MARKNNRIPTQSYGLTDLVYAIVLVAACAAIGVMLAWRG